jgi:CheY-like chemotaxis protein
VPDLSNQAVNSFNIVQRRWPAQVVGVDFLGVARILPTHLAPPPDRRFEEAIMDQFAGRPPRRCAPHRVLIIEDNHDAADSLGRLLILLGQQVRIAYSGSEGVDTASKWLPTVVISDIGLPGLDGYEVARALRRAWPTAGAKLIALSAYGTEESRRTALKAGFDEYLTKPADLDILQGMLGVGQSCDEAAH